MFEDGARLDDIMNVLKPPTLDDEEDDKKKERVSDAGLRYSSRKDFGDDNIQYEFTKQLINSGVWK